MSLLRAILSIPILPMARRHGWWSNHRTPDARWLSPHDVVLNVSNSWYGFINRRPETAWMHRDSQNQYSGHVYQPESRNHHNDPFGS